MNDAMAHPMPATLHETEFWKIGGENPFAFTYATEEQVSRPLKKIPHNFLILVLTTYLCISTNVSTSLLSPLLLTQKTKRERTGIFRCSKFCLWEN